MVTHAPMARKLKIKLGGRIVNQRAGNSTEDDPSADTNLTLRSGPVEPGTASPTSHALSILKKMGTGRLTRGQQLMAPRPASWGQLSQQATSKQLQPSQPTASETKTPDLPQSTTPATAHPRDFPPRPNAGGKTTKEDQVNGIPKGKGKDEKATGAANGQKRPAWGASQPPLNASRVAEARSFKRLRKSQSPPLIEAAEPPKPPQPDYLKQPQAEQRQKTSSETVLETPANGGSSLMVL